MSGSDDEVTDFFKMLLGGPPGRPQHPDFMKLSSVVLKHDGPTTDPATMHIFSIEERIAQEVDFETLTYMCKQRATTYLGQLGLGTDAKMLAVVASAWVDAFLIGVEWERAAHGTNEG